MKSLKLYLQKKLINLLVKHLFNGIVEEDILRIENGKVTVQGEELPKEKLTAITAEANAILNSPLWKLLTDEMKYLANQQMFIKSIGIEDMIFGKAMLYNLDIIEKKLKNLEKL